MTLQGFVLRNLLRNTRRTLLTVISIAVSLAMIVIMQTVLAELLNPTGMNESVPRVVIRHRTSLTFSLPDSYEAKIRETPGIAAVTPLNWFGGIYKSEDQANFFPRFAVDPDTFFDVYFDYKPSQPEYLDALKAERTACLVGEKLMASQNFKIGQKIVVTGDIYPVDLELTVRGTYKGQDETWLMFQRKYLDELLGESARSGTFFALVESGDAVPGVIKTLEERFRNSDAEVKVETEKAFQLSFVQMLGNVQLLFRSLIGVTAFAVVLIAASTMAMAMRERTREVAVLKMLGFQGSHLLFMVMAEGTLIACAGGVLGIGGTWLLLPQPKWFLSAAAALVVACAAGGAMLLLGMLLPEASTALRPTSIFVRLRAFLWKFGPGISIGLGVLVLAGALVTLPPMDWLAFSSGFFPFVYVRPATILFGGTLAIVIGLGSSLFPAIKAARISALDAMREME